MAETESKPTEALLRLFGQIRRSVTFRARHLAGRLRKSLWRWRHRRAIQDEFGSHEAVIDALFDLFSPRFCLELGMGLSSTAHLLRHARTLVSVEHHPEWFRRTLQSLDLGETGFVAVSWAGEDVQGALDFLDLEGLELALVDGPGPSRVPCARRLVGVADFVLLHDTDAVCYGWESFLASLDPVETPFHTFRDRLPWTTVVARDAGALQRLVESLGGDRSDTGTVFSPVR